MKEKIFKKGITKRLFSAVLALAMALTLMPMNTLTVKAAEPALIPGSTTVYWSKTAGGVVTISGVGAMPPIQNDEDRPWAPTGDIDESVTAVVIEEGVTKVSRSAFMWCKNLTSVSIAASVTELDNYAFQGNDGYGCTNLSTVSIAAGSQLKRIGQNAFKDQESLTSFTIPAGVERIEREAFNKCGITNITIPASVTYLGESTFSGDEYKYVTFEAKTPYVDADNVYGDYFENVVAIYVPKSAVNTYKNEAAKDENWWSFYADKIQEIPHTHNLVYTATDATLTAYCTETTGALSCDCQGTAEDLSNAVSLTLTASSANYSGLPVTVCTDGTNADAVIKYNLSDWTTANAGAVSAKYVGRAGTTYESETAPTEVGKYTVKVYPASEDTTPTNIATADFEIKAIEGTYFQPKDWGQTIDSIVMVNNHDGTIKFTELPVFVGNSMNGTTIKAEDLSWNYEALFTEASGMLITNADKTHLNSDTKQISNWPGATPLSINTNIDVTNVQYDDASTPVIAVVALTNGIEIEPGRPYSFGSQVFILPTKVTYNLNGGTAGTGFVAEDWVISGEEWLTNNSVVNHSIVPTKAGNAFDGWYTASEGGTKVTTTAQADAAATSPESGSGSRNVTLYAHWTPHSHDWKYSSTTNKLEAYCANEGCDHYAASYNAAKTSNKLVTLTMSANNVNYSGSPATVKYGEGQELAWLQVFGRDGVPIIKYYNEDGTTPTDKDNSGAGTEGGAPSRAGKYVAKATYTDGQTYTISLNFEVKNHNLTPATATMIGITLDDEKLEFNADSIANVFEQKGVSASTGDYVVYKADDSRYKLAQYDGSKWVDIPVSMQLDGIKTNLGTMKIYIIGTVQEPSRPSSGGSSYTPPATNATIGGETGSTTNVSVNTSSGQATVSDIPKNTVDSIANSNVNGSDIVLDVSKAGNSQITKVTLTKSTVENISKALDSSDNNKTNLVVKTGNAEVTFDAAAVKAIAEQASAGSIQIVVENTTGANLNNSQKKVVEDLGKGNGEKQVVQTFEASIISGGRKISNFMGGNVTVAQINFTVPAGKKASNYHVYYIPTSGAAEKCVTWVKDGRIYFVTGHFSDYVIVYDEAVSNGEGIPVYRLYHGKLGDHLFTTSATERDAVQKLGYKLEGVGFYASGTGNKVYRLYNGTSGEHFYTASEKERDLCMQHNWRLEGVAFTTEGEKKVYRLYNGKVHFYTTSEKEKELCLAHGWKLEGVGYTAN